MPLSAAHPGTMRYFELQVPSIEKGNRKSRREPDGRWERTEAVRDEWNKKKTVTSPRWAFLFEGHLFARFSLSQYEKQVN